jgi:hypothetical protein
MIHMLGIQMVMEIKNHTIDNVIMHDFTKSFVSVIFVGEVILRHDGWT